MAKKEHIIRHSANELAAKRAESRTDWTKASSMTGDQLEASIAADPDEAGMVVDWESATIEMPRPKALLNMRVDQDVLDFFRKTGKGYQTRINAVLRCYVARMRHEKALMPTGPSDHPRMDARVEPVQDEIR